ncbi:MAG: hypothetical protein PWP58_380 [Bacillota bacterium]|jgi:hypothetical protein|nr:hypothetical protein [Bacillota bacterium]
MQQEWPFGGESSGYFVLPDVDEVPPAGRSPGSPVSSYTHSQYKLQALRCQIELILPHLLWPLVGVVDVRLAML